VPPVAAVFEPLVQGIVSGATTVIFDAPSGDAGWNWHRVLPEVAKHTRACVFDRAGFGFSDPD